MKNNKISGAEAVIRCLLEEGVDLVYGYPGGAIMPVYDELYKFKDELEPDYKEVFYYIYDDIFKLSKRAEIIYHKVLQK